ncbi:MAG: hypothetical protein WD398_01365, partial [Cyclobacteriaceae bacterium]
MHKFFKLETMEGSFHLADGNDFNTTLKATENHLKFFWNFGAVPLKLDIDGQMISLEPNQLLSCTYL